MVVNSGVFLLNSSLINVPPVTNSENQNILFQYNIDHPIIANSVLAQAGEQSLERWIIIRVLGEMPLNFTQNATGLCLGPTFATGIWFSAFFGRPAEKIPVKSGLKWQ